MAETGRREQIDTAGAFRRALRESPGPGGQGFGEVPLPAKEVLLALRERSLTMPELVERFGGSWATVTNTVTNLQSLGLVEFDASQRGNALSLTDLGREVAERHHGG